jgi:formylglycine-generating enzyme required for sulfatase activity
LVLEGRFPAIPLGSRFLARPGTYRIVATKEGYRTLEATIDLFGSGARRFTYELEELPGRVALATTPKRGVVVFVNKQELGETPLAPIELPAGEHSLLLRAKHYRDLESTLMVDGEGTLTHFEAALEPLWAPVTFHSTPAGATIWLGAKAYGMTPLTIDLLEGLHYYEARLPGRKPRGGRIQVTAGVARTVNIDPLAPADGTILVVSDPDGASVMLNGTFVGRAPMTLDVQPESHEIVLSLFGYETERRNVAVASEQSSKLSVLLTPRVGVVEMYVTPPDAEVSIDGKRVGATNGSRTFSLPARQHVIEVYKPGHQAFRGSVTPRPGFPQTIEVELELEHELEPTEALESKAPDGVLRTSAGQELRFVAPHRFQMGASRREPGRRANETLRDVSISRPFYLGTTEVTNAEFRAFDPSHDSGKFSSASLNDDALPVVRVSWEQAAAYCNWLSDRESLTRAYVERDGRHILAQPVAEGYRLPSEAEWALAARYPNGTGSGMKYAWGDALPVPHGSGNYADASASGSLAVTLPGYEDSFEATAPVTSGMPSQNGFYHLGGNVAEWTNDFYSIPSSSGVAENPTGPSEGKHRVIRGASFMDGSVTRLRLSYRDYADQARPDVGFRIARNANHPASSAKKGE